MKKFKKNWKKICEMEDIHFMWALALLDLDTEFGCEIAESRFEEYFDFSYEHADQDNWPVPLSVLFTIARYEVLIKKDGPPNTDMLICFGQAKWKSFGIVMPIKYFSTNEDKSYFQAEFMPDEIIRQIKEKGGSVKVGDSFIWGGKSMVLLENNEDCEYMCFAPAECVDVSK